VSNHLQDLELEKVELMEKLAGIGQEQKAVQAEVRRVERVQRAVLEDVAEHYVPEDVELTLEDVEAWCRSAFSIMAHSSPANPHQYWNRKKVEHSEMYTRVVRYVLEHGYPQQYGREPYTVLDVRLHSATFFIWPMCDDPEESMVLNAKPDAMRPEREPQPTLEDGRAGAR
jgi:hypothetical protein